MAPFLPIPEAIRPAIDAYWSSFLGCTEDLLYPAHRVSLRSSRSPGVLGLQTQRHWLFAFAPSVTTSGVRWWMYGILPLLATRRGALPGWHPLWQRGWQRVASRLGRRSGLVDIYGPAYLLYCSQVIPQAEQAVAIRPLTAADQPAVQQFQQGMGVVVWQLDQPQLWPRLCGIFQDGQLVATGAVRLWADAIGEIFVDTLPLYRKRGYARALTAHLTDWVLCETPWLPQYDTTADNLPSLRVAHAVGYRSYGMMLLATPP